MGKASREAARRERERARRKKFIRNALIASAVVIIIIVSIVVAGVSNQSNSSSQSINISLNEDGNLYIERSALIDGFNYVDWGGDEDLILYRTGDGDVMAAFDTCEECYPRGSVHFTLSGQNMVCSICGTTSAVSGFGAQSWGGCQPVAIPTVARQDTDNEIIISSEAIYYALHMFEQWDGGDMSVTFENFGEQ